MTVNVEDIFFEDLDRISDNVARSLLVQIYQAITAPIVEAMAKTGGNALRLRASDGHLCLITIACGLDDEEGDDKKAHRFVSTVLNGIRKEAVLRGLENGYM